MNLKNTATIWLCMSRCSITSSGAFSREIAPGKFCGGNETFRSKLYFKRTIKYSVGQVGLLTLGTYCCITESWKWLPSIFFHVQINHQLTKHFCQLMVNLHMIRFVTKQHLTLLSFPSRPRKKESFLPDNGGIVFHLLGRQRLRLKGT